MWLSNIYKPGVQIFAEIPQNFELIGVLRTCISLRKVCMLHVHEPEMSNFRRNPPKLWTKRRTEDNHSNIWEISAKYCTPINSILSILYFNAVHFLGDFSEKLSFPRFVQSVLCWIHAFFGRFRRKNVLPQFIHMHFLGDFSENLCFCDCVLSFLFETCIFSEFSAKICLRKCAVGHFRKKYCFWIGNFLTYFPKKKNCPNLIVFPKKFGYFLGNLMVLRGVKITKWRGWFKSSLFFINFSRRIQIS